MRLWDKFKFWYKYKVFYKNIYTSRGLDIIDVDNVIKTSTAFVWVEDFYKTTKIYSQYRSFINKTIIVFWDGPWEFGRSSNGETIIYADIVNGKGSIKAKASVAVDIINELMSIHGYISPSQAKPFNADRLYRTNQ